MEAATAEKSDRQTNQETAALAAICLVLLSDPAPEALEAALLRALDPAPVELAFRDRARVKKAVRLAVGLLPPQRPLLGHPSGPAGAWVRRTSVPRRAAYLLAAARRLNEAEGRDVEAERRFLAQHLSAERGRTEAALAADRAVAEHGLVLGWYAKRPFDEATSPGCRSRHGSNFNVLRPPVVEGRPALPGMVHPACRCSPGPPWPGASLLA